MEAAHLAHADGCNGRMVEDDGRDVLVVETGAAVATVEAVGKLSARSDCYRRQLHLACREEDDETANRTSLPLRSSTIDVAEGEDVIHVRLLELVGGNVAALVGLHSTLLETEAFGERNATDCEQGVVQILQLKTIPGLNADSSIDGKLHTVKVGIAVDVHTMAREVLLAAHSATRPTCIRYVVNTDVHYLVLDALVELSQHIFMSDKQMSFASEPLVDASQFDGDITSADDRHFLRQLLKLEEVCQSRLRTGFDCFEMLNMMYHRC